MAEPAAACALHIDVDDGDDESVDAVFGARALQRLAGRLVHDDP